MLTLDRLKEIISYDPESGEIRWKETLRPSLIGQLAGYIDNNGYRCIQIGGVPHKAHRVAWFYMTGVMPKEYVDHINGQKADNKFCNLRLASNSQNQSNRPAPKNNTSGTKGIRFEPSRNKWRAVIWVRGRVMVIGRFDTKEAAAAAYETAAKNAFGEYAHGAEIKSSLTPVQIGIGIIERGSITAEILRSELSYDPDTGQFTRIKAIQGRAKVGDIAGSTEWTGYRKIKIRGRSYREHHLAWLYVYGYMPGNEVDHINGDPADNRIGNLRECKSTQNKHNTRGHKDSVTGFKGVGYDARCVRKYYSRIKVPSGDVVHIGNFHTAEEASRAYQAAARVAFGDYAKT